jgi:hypothetical protein
MTNLQKMNELVGTQTEKQKIINWAYMNRICVADLFEEVEFSQMENSVTSFVESDFYNENFDDEMKLWNQFLDLDYID